MPEVYSNNNEFEALQIRPEPFGAARSMVRYMGSFLMPSSINVEAARGYYDEHIAGQVDAVLQQQALAVHEVQQQLGVDLPDLTPGAIINVVDPEKLMSVGIFRTQADVGLHLKAIACQLYLAHDSPEISKDVWKHWGSDEGLVDPLIPVGYRGLVRGLSLTVLEADEAFMAENFSKKDGVSSQDVVRLNAELSLRSRGGRSVLPAAAEFVVYQQHNQTNGLQLRWKMTDIAAADLAYFQTGRRAAATARGVEATQVRRASKSGLPGHGKRR